ncbi:MAG: DMT family transporter [Phycisphaerales bacterium]|nr:DMT family transporter [Phycisphaerales bacterium]
MVAAVFIALCLIWSSTWVVIVYATDGVPPCTSAAVRFWIASALLMVVHLFRPIAFPRDWRTRLGILGLGVPHIGISYALVYWAEQHISSGLTAVVYLTYPCFVAAYSAWLFTQERWTAGKVAGLVFGIVGVCVVSFDENMVRGSVAIMGVLAALLSSAISSFVVVAIKRWYAHHDSVAITVLQLLAGAITLTVFALLLEFDEKTDWKPRVVAATLYLAIFGSAIAFFGFYWLLKRVESTVASMITFVFPPLAVGWGWLLKNEPVTKNLFVGGALVLIGVWLVVRASARASAAKRVAGFDSPSPEPICQDGG